MGYPSKIATCCYCGAKAALVMSGDVRHELACSNCGAPLHDMKILPKKKKTKAVSHKAVSHAEPRYMPERPKARPKKRKRSRLFMKALDEAFDLIEDIFD